MDRKTSYIEFAKPPGADRLLLAFVVMIALLATGCEPQTWPSEPVQVSGSLSLVGDFTLGPLECNDDRLVIFGSEKIRTTGEGAGYRLEPRGLIVSNETLGSPFFLPLFDLSEGVVRSASLANGRLFVVIAQSTESGDMNSRLLVSDDMASTWRRLFTPGDCAIGIDFTNDLEGFAWCSDALYFSADGGATWTGGIWSSYIPGGTAARSPAVDGAGRLWIPTEDTVSNANRYDSFKVVERSGNTTSIGLPEFDDIWAFSSGSPQERMYFLSRRGVGAPYELMAYENGDLLTLNLAIADGETPYRLVTFGSSIVIQIGKGLSDVRRTLASSNGGRTWQKLPYGDRVRGMCLGGENVLWVIESPGNVLRQQLASGR